MQFACDLSKLYILAIRLRNEKGECKRGESTTGYSILETAIHYISVNVRIKKKLNKREYVISHDS